MRNTYMPAIQAVAVAWSDNFIGTLGVLPDKAGVSDNLYDQFVTVNDELQAAWAATQRAETRNAITIERKNMALRAMKQLAASLVSIIQGTPGVGDDTKRSLGITIRDRKPTPVPVPKFKPIVEIQKVDGRGVSVRLRQSRDSRARPVGVAGASVYFHLGADAPVEMREWRFYGNFARTTFDLRFPPSATGETLWVSAMWFNTRQEAGPAAQRVSVNLPAGGSLPRQGLKLARPEGEEKSLEAA